MERGICKGRRIERNWKIKTKKMNKKWLSSGLLRTDNGGSRHLLNSVIAQKTGSRENLKPDSRQKRQLKTGRQ